jgi:3D-(3,5/4)-trihydroxycyclohexane-1,2-dione acylhydrolase (decyclizing)
VGDGTYLMMSSEIVTSIQEGYKLNIILVENHGFASIGSLSRSLGNAGFGTSFRKRNPESGQLDGDFLPINFVDNARGYGALALEAYNLVEFKKTLEVAKNSDRTTVIVVHTDSALGVPGYESWWDVAVAEVSQIDEVNEARREYVEKRKKERYFF